MADSDDGTNDGAGGAGDGGAGNSDNDAANTVANLVNNGAGGDGAGGDGDGGGAIWNLAEGIPGQGDRPEWFHERYSSVSDQAKAYKDLESKFGTFTGAPENGTYEINLSEELTKAGVEITNDDPLFEDAAKFANESGMSQEGFDKMMNLYATAKIAEQAAVEEYKQTQIASLGANGQGRVDNLIAWGRANLSEEMFAGFEQMPESANAIKALEHMISLSQGKPLTPDNVNGGEGGVSREELNAMQFEKDEYGNRKLQTDPAFKKRFDELMSKTYGTHDHNIIVGAK